MATALKKIKKRPLPEMNRMVRELSHDINANFMVLEDSFRQLKQHVDENSIPHLLEETAHVEACLKASKNLLEDLVCLSKTGEVDMRPAPTDVAEILAEVLFEQNELLSGRSIEVNVPPQLPQVLCHPKRLKQVLTNVIRNAAIHGCDDKNPRIGISADIVAPNVDHPNFDKSMTKIIVHDNGPGIPHEDADDIFLPGKRMCESSSRGGGMGLAIVRRIAQYYGGSVEVDHAYRKGTAIAIRFPTSPMM